LIDLLQAAHHHLTGASDRLTPTKTLFNQFSLADRDGVARTGSDGVGDSRAASRGVLRHVRDGPQKLLECDAGATTFDVGLVHAGEKGIHIEQSGVDHHTDRAQWMVGWRKVLELTHGEKTLGEGVSSSHEFGSGRDLWIGLDLTFEGVPGWTDLGVFQQPVNADCLGRLRIPLTWQTRFKYF
jgi:hypothetical protein